MGHRGNGRFQNNVFDVAVDKKLSNILFLLHFSDFFAFKRPPMNLAVCAVSPHEKFHFPKPLPKFLCNK